MSSLPNRLLQEPIENQTFAPDFDVNRLVLTVTDDLGAVRRTWRGLEQRAAGHVFQTHAWVSNWHNHIGRARAVKPVIITGSTHDGVARMVLPMGLKKRGGFARLTWLGDEHADYKGPLIDAALLGALTPETARILFKRTFALVPEADTAYLEEMPVELNGQAHPLTAFRTQPSPVASHALALGQDFEALYKARRGAGSRKKLRQKRRRLEQSSGPVEFRIAASPHARSRAISVLIGQKRARLEERGITDMFAQPEVRAFYRSLAEQHPELCQLSTLNAGDEAVAANWGLIWGDRYYYVLSTMTDTDLRAYSPGQLHLNELIEWSSTRGLRTFDFTVGDEDYKDDWCDSTTALFDVHLGLTTKGQLLASTRALTRRIKRQVKQSGTLWPLAQKARKQANSLRKHTGW